MAVLEGVVVAPILGTFPGIVSEPFAAGVLFP
jgi:hypothetical protein